MITVDSIYPNRVSILIGSNGSGKSRLLRRLCTSFLNRGDDVIGVAPTIYDRFRRMPQEGFHFFGARQGRTAATKVIRTALERASSENLQVFRNLTRALDYTKFDPVIGIAISNLNFENFSAAAEQLPRSDAEELKATLMKWQNRYESGDVVRLSLDKYSFQELDDLSFTILARHEGLLSRTKTASRIKYFLYRHGEQIPLLEACSGEINFITTIAFISTQIKPHSVIAIDEPDTSLHPTWQQSYVDTLLDLFHRYEPRIVISTHSPIIISGAEAANGSVSVYEMKNGEASIFEHSQLSLEEMYDRLFGLITPKNHYLSQRAVTMLNALNSGDKSLKQVVDELEKLRNKSYDESQKEVISKFEEVARKLESIKIEESK